MREQMPSEKVYGLVSHISGTVTLLAFMGIVGMFGNGLAGRGETGLWAGFAVVGLLFCGYIGLTWRHIKKSGITWKQYLTTPWIGSMSVHPILAVLLLTTFFIGPGIYIAMTAKEADLKHAVDPQVGTTAEQIWAGLIFFLLGLGCSGLAVMQWLTERSWAVHGPIVDEQEQIAITDSDESLATK
jgi:hypothetical protein